jgi:secondary thiamine-phosphate synthase enzyme
MFRINIETTERVQAIDITKRVQAAVKGTGVGEGLLRLHCPHTTASIVVNECVDPDVVRDILATYERLVPRSGDYHHLEGNSQAHILASLLGCGITLPIESSKAVLGTWQGIFLLELDGPRKREVWLTCLGKTR